MARDPEKQRAAKQRWYEANRHVYLERNARKRRERQEYVRAVKESTPCADCGVSYPSYVMDFDHLGDKEHLISTLVVQGGMKRLTDEIAKCEVVCANCHRERTHQRRQSEVV